MGGREVGVGSQLSSTCMLLACGVSISSVVCNLTGGLYKF